MEPFHTPLIQLAEIELMGANPGPYSETLKWRIRIDILDALTEPLCVSFVWVGSSRSSQFDQVLDSFDVGPFTVGPAEFQLECDPPQLELIPPEDVVGLTVLLVSFQYRGCEFLRVGYYTQVAYFDDQLNSSPPAVPDISQLGRLLAMAQPAVTAVPIAWDGQYEQAASP
jgi:histone chaperone ASF1